MPMLLFNRITHTLLIYTLHQKVMGNQKRLQKGIQKRIQKRIHEFGNGDVLFRGVIELKMVENSGEGGVKNPKKSGDVL